MQNAKVKVKTSETLTGGKSVSAGSKAIFNFAFCILTFAF
jgi:hypothetical protein